MWMSFAFSHLLYQSAHSKIKLIFPLFAFAYVNYRNLIYCKTKRKMRMPCVAIRRSAAGCLNGRMRAVFWNWRAPPRSVTVAWRVLTIQASGIIDVGVDVFSLTRWNQCACAPFSSRRWQGAGVVWVRTIVACCPVRFRKWGNVNGSVRNAVKCDVFVTDAPVRFPKAENHCLSNRLIVTDNAKCVSVLWLYAEACLR